MIETLLAASWLCPDPDVQGDKLRVTYQAEVREKFVRKTMRKINRVSDHWKFVPHRSGWGRADITVTKHREPDFRVYQTEAAEGRFIWARVPANKKALWWASGVYASPGCPP